MCDWGNYSDIISALSSALTVFITLALGVFAFRFSKYQVRQNDRRIVEELFEDKERANRIWLPEAKFTNQEAWSILAKASFKAKLYGLKNIFQSLEKLNKLYGEGYVLEKEIWTTSGYQRSDFKDQSKMNRYHEIVAEFMRLIENNKPYQDRLKIE